VVEQLWDRSWIFVKDGSEKKGADTLAESEAYLTTRAYVLQRWVNACGGRGSFPVKFNGSIFTVDAIDKGKNYDADFRRWGGCYWWQNTRLPYWGMLSAGDYDLMKPLFKQYSDVLPLLEDRTQAYFKHSGAFFSETMYFWGTCNNANFGWDNPDMYPVNTNIKRYWQSGIELTTMMLDYYAHTGDESFATDKLLPVTHSVLAFYWNHFSLGPDGKLFIDPAQALEGWQKASNPTPDVAGLGHVLDRLQSLPSQLGTASQRAEWKHMRETLPELPVKEVEGQRVILPATEFSEPHNVENPELYAIFPYKVYTRYNPDLEVGLETFNRRRVKKTGGWHQDAVQAALLGLADEAKGFVVTNASTKNTVAKNQQPAEATARFPAFWGPNHDWIPDQDHGSITCIALQRMLMQSEGKAIYLLPAWPNDWNAHFKLHAPMNTTVEAEVENGKIISLKVVPKSRRSDIVILNG
jgi:alpha-L-fucosidase 2